MTDSTDTLIVGHGLAGAILAWYLVQYGQRVVIVDNNFSSSASVVAAGIVNPLMGKRLVKADNADETLASATEFYQSCENKFGQSYYYPIPMLRLLAAEQDKQQWQKRKAQSGYQEYIGEFMPAQRLDRQIIAPSGGYLQYKTAYLDIRSFLTNLKSYYKSTSTVIDAQLDFQDLVMRSTAVQWKHKRADRIIFCDGYQSCENPWFNWLPYQLAYGSILTVRVSEPTPGLIINNGKWILPVGRNTLRIGATFHWRQINGQSRETDKQILIQSLLNMLKLEKGFKVTGQHDGARPATKDKFPFIGMHPDQARVGIFNGFGAKGVMTIPYYAQLFAKHLIYGDELPDNVSLRRIEAQ